MQKLFCLSPRDNAGFFKKSVELMYYLTYVIEGISSLPSGLQRQINPWEVCQW